MLKTILAILFILNIPLSFSQSDVQYALIRDVRGLEVVPDQMKDRLRKLSMQVVLKQPGFQVLLSAEEIPSSSTVEIFAIESDIVKENDRYQIESKLLDLKKKTLVRKATVKNIRESDLLRLFQASIEAIFKPKKEVETEKVPEEKKEVTKKTTPPPATVITSAKPNAIDFKERINSIKIDVDRQVVKAAEAKKEEPKDELQKKNPNLNPQDRSSSNMVAAELPSPEKKPESYKGKSSYDLMFGWDKRVLLSDYFISTRTNTEMFTIKLSSHTTTRFFSERLAWSWDGAFTKLISGKIDPPNLYQAGLYLTWLDNWGYLSLGGMRDRSFYSNLSSPGQGLQLFTLDSDWILAKGQIRIPFLKDLKIHFAHGTLLQVTSGMSQAQWSGNLFRAGIIPPRLVSNWDLNIMIEKIELSNQGVVPFTSEDSRMALFIQRSF